MPYSTRSRVASTKDDEAAAGPSSKSSRSTAASSTKSKRNKLVQEEQNLETKSSPPPEDIGKRKVARPARKLGRAQQRLLQEEEEDDEFEKRDSLADFKAPKGPVVTTGATKVRKKVNSKAATATAKPKGGRGKVLAKQPTLLDSSFDDDNLTDDSLFEAIPPPSPILAAASRRNPLRSSARLKKNDTTDSSRASIESVASTRSTRGRGGGGGGRSRSKKKVPEIVLITTDESEDEREIAGAAIAAAAVLKKKGKVNNVSKEKDTSTSTAKGRGKKKEVKKSVAEEDDEEEFLMPPPITRPTRQLRDRSKVNNSSNNVSSASSTTANDKSANSGKENATPGKEKMVTFLNAKQEPYQVNAEVFTAQCRSHAKRVLQVNAKLCPFPDPTLMEEMKSLQEELKRVVRQTRQTKASAASAAAVAAKDGKKEAVVTGKDDKKEAVVPAKDDKKEAVVVGAKEKKDTVAVIPKIDTETEEEDDMFEEFKEAEESETVKKAKVLRKSEDMFEQLEVKESDKLEKAKEVMPSTSNNVPVPSTSNAVPEDKDRRNSRKRGRSPEKVQVETKKIGPNIVTFDFQAAADKMKETQHVPSQKKCVVEVIRCDEEEKKNTGKKQEETVPPAAELEPAVSAHNATFDIGLQDVPVVPVSLDATFVKDANIDIVKEVKVEEPQVTVVSTAAQPSTPSKGLRRSARNSAKSGISEDPSEYFDAVPSPLVHQVHSENQESEDAESSVSLFETSQVIPATPPTTEKKVKGVLPPAPNKEANETICLTNPLYLPKSALQPPSAALRLGPWLPSAPGLDALIEEDSQDSVKSGTQVRTATKVVEKDLLLEALPRTERCADGTVSSSSSSSSGSSFKSAKGFPASANSKPFKSNMPSKEMFNFTKKNAEMREKEAQKKKDEIIQQKKDLQQKKNEEWAKRAEKIRLEDLKKREELEKKLQRDEADRKLQDEAKSKAKPPMPSVLTKPPKAQEKLSKPLAVPKFAFGQSTASKVAESHGGGFSNLAFKASGPMSGFKSAPSDAKLAYQSKIKTVIGQSTPKYGAPSSSLKTAKGASESNDGFKVPDAPHPNYNYSFLDSTHENSYISSYEITRYEDLDDEMTHRDNKHVPEWALNKQDLTCALFKQSLMGQFPAARTPFPKPDKRFKLFP